MSFYRFAVLFVVVYMCLAAVATSQVVDTFYYNSRGVSVAKADAIIYCIVKKENGTHYVSSYKMNGPLIWTCGFNGFQQKHGRSKRFDDDGCVREEGMYENGVQVGEWLYYYSGCSNRVFKSLTYEYDSSRVRAKYYDSATGAVKSAGILTDGKRQGSWTFYYRGTQKLELEGAYWRGKANGPTVNYDSTTSLKISEGNHLNGKRDGAWNFYFPGTTKLQVTENYKEGKLHGELRRYDSASSKLLWTGKYEKDRRIGVWSFYHRGSGKLKAEALYKNGLRDGAATEFDSLTGLKNAEGRYDQGKISGKWNYYYPGSDRIRAVKSFKDGILDGAYSEYDTTGFRFASVDYKDGKKHGDWRTYFSDTKSIWFSARFENDLLDGKLETHYASGKKRRIEMYNNGKLVSGVCFAQDGSEIAYYPFVVEADYVSDVMNYIANNVKYPDEAAVTGIDGSVLVGFVVDALGRVKNVEVLKGLGNGFDEEALKVIAGMHAWRPMYVDGIPVDSYVQLLVSFTRPRDGIL